MLLRSARAVLLPLLRALQSRTAHGPSRRPAMRCMGGRADLSCCRKWRSLIAKGRRDPMREADMHDIVIRGGSIVDGTGKAAFTGDVAIADGRIAAVGGKQGPARREIDATGLMVTPGWVDVHTHYDGQAMWDPLLAPSCWYGVTTVLFGNCGVGFAPVKKHHRQALMDLMEGVEEIPNPVLAAGLTWEWETFPDFMDALERRERVIDIAAQAAHLPMRVYVMGDRAIRREKATADDIAQMK